jgi:hypothetical protein
VEIMTRIIRGGLLSVALLVVQLVGAQFPSASTRGTIDLANMGDVKAQVNVAFAYYVAKNYEEALKWFQKVADQDGTDPSSAYAYYAIGSMTTQGLGVKQDFSVAHLYLSKAAALGNQEARKLLETGTRNLIPTQLPQVQSEEKNLHISGRSRPPFQFVKEQRVYIVALEGSYRDPSLERLTRDLFEKRRSFRVVHMTGLDSTGRPIIGDCDFVFVVLVDGLFNAFAVSPADFGRAGEALGPAVTQGVGLEGAMNIWKMFVGSSPLWQATAPASKKILLAMIPLAGPPLAAQQEQSEVRRRNAVASLVKRFHRDTIGK